MTDSGGPTDDIERDRVFSEVGAALFPGEFSGLKVGRFEVVSRIGSGAMGIVYEARDEELGRRVALKLLEPWADGETEQRRLRLAREARALARLSHPNVVQVYEVGTHGDQLFVAMELVGGTTLRQWLAERERSQEAILGVLLGAAAGLAAAHERDLVHRDFKPENVLIDSDDVAKVADFGLARVEAETEGSLPSARPVGTGLELTHTGARVGTPVYMAPEQFDGAPIDHRADQFAFCVVLYEALRGERPFVGESPDEIRRAIAKGPPSLSPLPPQVRRALGRGLGESAADRFSSMRELARVLDRNPWAARRRWLGAGGIAVVAAGAAFGLSTLSSGASCDVPDDALVGVWDAEVAEQVRSAFASVDTPLAGDTRVRVSKLLDQRAQDWKHARREACEATRVRGEQSEQMLDLRMACLDRRRLEMEAVSRALSKPPGQETLRRAVESVRALPDLARCADVEELGAAIPLPADDSIRSRIEAVRGRITEIDARGYFGSPSEQLAAASRLSTEARSIGWPPLLAEALYSEFQAARRAGDLELAVKTGLEATKATAAARDDRLAAATWTDLVSVVGVAQRRDADAEAYRRMAEAALVRIGGDARLQAELLNVVGIVRKNGGDYGVARRVFEEAAELAQKPGEAMALASILDNLGNVLRRLGQQEAARESHERALALFEGAVGRHHPVVARVHENLGILAKHQGRFDDALAHYERASEIREDFYDEANPETFNGFLNLGNVQKRLGLYDAAMASYAKSEAGWRKTLGDEHPDVALALTNLGGVLTLAGRFDEAESRLDDGLRIKKKVLEKDHPDLALSYEARGELDLARGRPSTALEHCTEAHRVNELHLKPGHRDLAYALSCIGRAHLGMKRSDDARTVLEQARKLWKDGRVDARDLGQLELALAQARRGAGSPISEVRTSAEQALEAFDRAGPRAKREKAEAERFLASL